MYVMEETKYARKTLSRSQTVDSIIYQECKKKKTNPSGYNNYYCKNLRVSLLPRRKNVLLGILRTSFFL